MQSTWIEGLLTRQMGLPETWRRSRTPGRASSPSSDRGNRLCWECRGRLFWWKDLRMVWGVSILKRLDASTCCTTAAGTAPSGDVPWSTKLKGVEEFERGGNAGRMGVSARTGSSRGAASATCTRVPVATEVHAQLKTALAIPTPYVTAPSSLFCCALLSS